MTFDECRKKIADIFGFHATPDRMMLVDEALIAFGSTPKPMPLTRTAPPAPRRDAEEDRLCDQFAICALNGMYAASDVNFGDDKDHEETAREAYDIAEAMLAERKNRRD